MVFLFSTYQLSKPELHSRGVYVTTNQGGSKLTRTQVVSIANKLDSNSKTKQGCLQLH